MKTSRATSLRSPMGRVLGLGSARDGAAHWWAQRVSAVALVPLTLWFLFSLIALPDFGYFTVRSWLATPISGFFSVLTVAVLAYHAYLGTAEIVEDYVHSAGAKLMSLLSLGFLFALAGSAGIFAVLSVVFRGRAA